MNVGSPPRRPSSGQGRSLPARSRRRPASPVQKAPLAAPVQSNEPVPADLVEVGRIVDAYGLAGWVKIAPHEPAPSSVLRGVRCCWLAPAAAGSRPQLREIAGLRLQGSALVAQIDGCADRDAALALKGSTLFLSRADFPATEPDEYYWVDLIGCSVAAGDGTAFGTVAAVEDFGADPVLRVVDDEGETLIPFVAAHVVAVDLAARRIVVDWRRDY